MNRFRTRVMFVVWVGWFMFGLGLTAGVTVIAIGGLNNVPLAIGLWGAGIAIAFALNLTLLAILWPRSSLGRKCHTLRAAEL